jgi:hypothetical protein
MKALDVETYKCVNTETVKGKEYDSTPERDDLEHLGIRGGKELSDREGATISSDCQASGM